MTLAEGPSTHPVQYFESVQAPPIWAGPEGPEAYSGYCWGAATAELLAAPQLIAGDDQTTVAAAHRRLASRIVRALRPWNNAGSLELRYLWGGEADRGRVRLILVSRALGSQLANARAWASQMLQSTTALFPPGYKFGSLEAELNPFVEAWMEIERAEEVRTPGRFVPIDAASFYYLIHPLGGSGAAWSSLPHVLTSEARPGFLSIVLMPTTLTDIERIAVDHVRSIAQYFAEPQQTHDFFGNPVINPADAAARDLHETWQRFPDRNSVMVRIGVSAATPDVARLSSSIATILADGADQSASNIGDSFKLVGNISAGEATYLANLGLVYPRNSHAVWSLPPSEAPVTLARMPYCFSEDEAGGVLALPVPDVQGVPGMSRTGHAAARRAVVSNVADASPGATLGRALHHGEPTSEVVVPLTALNRHTLVVGASGAGKTTTVLSLLTEIWRRHRIPFLAIEPIKQEYRSLLATPGFEDLRIVCLGRDDIAPLRLNPLAPPPGVRREAHMGAVMAALKLALPLPPPLPQLLELALDRTYQVAGWDYDTTTDMGLLPPTLRDLLEGFEAVFESQGYVGEAQNVGVAFRVRLTGLLTGSRGRILDTVESTDFDELLRGPAIIELNEVADPDDKALLSAFLLSRLRAAASARGSSGGLLRHVTVLEEAHRLLGRDAATTGDPQSGDKLRAESVRAFCEAIGELRSSGEGFVLSSQSPADLARAALVNTGVKILHRMESASDREAVLNDLDASDLDRQSATRLQNGQALVRWAELGDPELVAVRAAEGVESGRVVNDAVVSERMRPHAIVAQSLLPYALCTRDICTRGCVPGIRAAGRRLAMTSSQAAGQIWHDRAGNIQALDPIASLLVQESTGDVGRAYCGAVHLAIERVAFNGNPNVVRPKLMGAVAEAAQVHGD